jgi:hypothetical protein
MCHIFIFLRFFKSYLIFVIFSSTGEKLLLHNNTVFLKQYLYNATLSQQSQELNAINMAYVVRGNKKSLLQVKRDRNLMSIHSQFETVTSSRWTNKKIQISGSHGGEYEDGCLLGCCAL